MRYIFILLLPILAFGASFIVTEDCITLQGDTDYILIKKTDAYIPPISGIIVHDYSGNGNDGTIYGDPVLADGKLTFNGVDQYLDTGLYPDDNWQYHVTARFKRVGVIQYLLGATDNVNRLYLGTVLLKWRVAYVNNVDVSTLYGKANTLQHDFILSNGVFFVDGVQKIEITYNWTSTMTQTLLIGARNDRGSDIDYFAECEIMEYECFTNNVKIQHFDFTTTEAKYLRFTP